MAISMSALESGERLKVSEHRDAFPASASIDRSRPIGEQVYRCMRMSSIIVALSSWDSVSESIVTDRFDISRTPVREAFRQLAAEGLLVIRPQAGTFVSAIDRVRWNEGRIVRRALETEFIQNPRSPDLRRGKFDGLGFERAANDSSSFHRTRSIADTKVPA